MECTVIGGGIQALSTGLLLEHAGHDTRMVAADFAYLDGEDVPSVTTNYAAASVYPVEVEADRSTDELTRRAEATFEPFYRTDGVAVRKHTHYYLYEDGTLPTLPDRMDVRRVDDHDDHAGELPKRPGATIEDGYVCSEYFVEMPAYVPQLSRTYQALGGETDRRTVTGEEVDRLPGDVVFNCAGYGGVDLFGDDSMRAIKGHILQVPYDGDEPLPFSYTYTPAEYDGYVYMYPRRETVLFGGSYLDGEVLDGEWEGERPERPLSIDGVTVPERVYSVNADIMGDALEITPDAVDAKYGYRPYRADGIRVERVGDVVHNYGHGGAGVALSWWSALRAVDAVDDVSEAVLADVAAEIRTHG